MCVSVNPICSRDFLASLADIYVIVGKLEIQKSKETYKVELFIFFGQLKNTNTRMRIRISKVLKVFVKTYLVLFIQNYLLQCYTHPISIHRFAT